MMGRHSRPPPSKCAVFQFCAGNFNLVGKGSGQENFPCPGNPVLSPAGKTDTRLLLRSFNMTVFSILDFCLWEESIAVFYASVLVLPITRSVSLGKSLEPLCASVSSSVRR